MCFHTPLTIDHLLLKTANELLQIDFQMRKIFSIKLDMFYSLPLIYDLAIIKFKKRNYNNRNYLIQNTHNGQIFFCTLYIMHWRYANNLQILYDEKIAKTRIEHVSRKNESAKFFGLG